VSRLGRAQARRTARRRQEVDVTSANLLLSGGRKWAVLAMPYFRARVDGFVYRPSAHVPRTAATKSGFFLYNEAEVEGRVAELGGDVRAAIETCAWSILHEALHLQLGHFARCGARDWQRWNAAADMSINSMLEKLAKKHVRRPPGRKIPSDLGLPMDLTADAYYALLPAADAAEALPRDGECGSCAHGRELPHEPDGDDAQAPSPQRLARVEREVAAEIARAQARSPGSVPGELAMWADATLAPPQVDWRRELRHAVRAPLGTRSGAVVARYDGPSRRQAGIGYGPGRPMLARPRGCIPSVVVAVDTSGSMHALGPAVLGELDGVLRAVGAEVTVVACDSRVHTTRRVRRIADAARGLVGGGGTDFHPIVDAARALKPPPALLVIVSDSWGPAPQDDPGIPAVWCLVGGATSAPAPWGRVVVVRDPPVSAGT
jgi:predicted metal-dependent peptidase